MMAFDLIFNVHLKFHQPKERKKENNAPARINTHIIPSIQLKKHNQFYVHDVFHAWSV